MHGSAGESANHSQKKPEFQTLSNCLKFRLSQKCWEEDYFFLSLSFSFFPGPAGPMSYKTRVFFPVMFISRNLEFREGRGRYLAKAKTIFLNIKMNC